MQSQRRSRLGPILKRIVMAVAVKKGIDMFQEARRPQKPSFLGRLAKLGMWSAGGGGLVYAFVSGKLQPIMDKVMGGSKSTNETEKWSTSASSPGGNVSSN
jgi:hypothetical protein